jgi:hypothetical protein
LVEGQGEVDAIDDDTVEGVVPGQGQDLMLRIARLKSSRTSSYQDLKINF